MPIVSVINTEGTEVEKLDLADNVFNAKVNKCLIHTAVVNYLANQRQGNKCTKTRAEVRGGGRKPWRQKGTGHARQGSIRSPQWRGGGVVFAPKPNDYSFKINKKVKRLALVGAISDRFQEKKLLVLEKIFFEKPKTKDMKLVLDNLNIKNALVIVDDESTNVYLSARNLPKIKVVELNIINVYDIIKFDYLILTKKVAMRLQEVYVDVLPRAL
jgi:large subunit ribosomal protein L4